MLNLRISNNHQLISHIQSNQTDSIGNSFQVLMQISAILFISSIEMGNWVSVILFHLLLAIFNTNTFVVRCTR